MQEPSIHHILHDTFPSSGKEDWLRMASHELPEKKSIENLVWSVDELKFNPYYDWEDTKNLVYLKPFQNRQPDTTYHPPGHWGNLPCIGVTEENSANERALQHLAAGADGILFDVSDGPDPDLHQLLKKIHWPSCTISFLAASDFEFANKLLAYANQEKYDPSQLTGSIYWKSLSKVAALKQPVTLSLNRFHSLGILIPRSSPVQEISTSLEQAVFLMDKLTDLGMEKESVFRSISLSFSCEENFFTTMAKLKAIRLLWYQLSQVYGIPAFSPEELQIHATAGKWFDEKFEPHGNLINSTTQMLAAVLGSCNVVTIVPEANNDMLHRIARNVAIILKEESHVDKVADPIAGSYALNCLVDGFSQAAWRQFQKNVST